MDKQLRIFIAIVVIFIMIAGIVTINEILEPKNAEVPQSNAETTSVIDREGEMYIVGQYLFTTATSYLSTDNIIRAAKTVSGLDTTDMTDDEILASVIVLARDAENNWINAMTGEMQTLPEDVEQGIRYIDLKEIPTEVSTEEELNIALSDNTVGIIDLKDDIEITDKIMLKDKEIIINFNGYNFKSSQEIISNPIEEALFTITDSFVSFIGEGVISSEGFNKGAIHCLGSSIDINSIDISGEYGMIVNSGEKDDLEISNSSVITIADSKIIGETAGIYFEGPCTVNTFACTITSTSGNALLTKGGGTIANENITGDDRITVVDDEGVLKLTVVSNNE